MEEIRMRERSGMSPERRSANAGSIPAAFMKSRLADEPAETRRFLRLRGSDPRK